METQTNKLQMALDKMQNQFSTYQFIRIAKKYGLSQQEIEDRTMLTFLQYNCNRISKFSWQKKTNNNKSILTKEDITEDIANTQFLQWYGWLKSNSNKYKYEVIRINRELI